MKRVALMIVLLLALPLAASASSTIDFTNSGGTLTGSSSGMSLSGSTLTAVNGLVGGSLITGNLGTVAFSTGALTSGSLAAGGTFAGGGSFTITGNGTNGLPNGIIFNGSFTGPVTWTLMAVLPNGSYSYMLSGVIAGTLPSGFYATGVTVQLLITTKGPFSGSGTVSSGDTAIVVPEPGTLGLLGTGLVGMAGALRRKFNLSR